MRSEAPSLMPIFRSRHQAEFLAQLLTHPGEEYSLSELSRAIGVPLTTLHREAERLAAAGLIRERKLGKNRMVSANTDNPAAAPLTQLLSLTFGPVAVIGEEFGGINGVEAIVIFGSWAARYAGEPGLPPNDIDVLVIGEAGQFDVFSAADRAQQRLGVEVNPQQCSAERWANPGDDPLIGEIRRRPHTVAFQRDGAHA
ncbi:MULTISPECIES: helix-turn-helix domain-containing protein [Mycobacterium]|uniref:ArsR family transcriptional regulator n=6 Tax=Mycobacterium TaxID=1763 RepID=A0AAW5RYG6_MYCBC|nr:MULTISPECIES: helix-turn-helix domain-containing protein [Mycobacterium]MBZ4631637.1 helix-turn-helix transcriptional regulator [Mycobacterium avium subsp. hominissuis]MCV6988128.1 helix-turn-helix transcriptional regulator [Mycobacterium bouchedurhonense]MCV6995030.1 helix-turn-helix transcriptional regulator [Mycobacterium timonense]MDV3306308.1 helix-turn-helix domain-containing protein [Mycobacterium avium subsp. hominissuis]ORA42152.1 ArsR family transcriptional regulator [Mycobacteriu